MKYNRVYVDSIGYELPPVVVTTSELEARLRPLYAKLRIPEGQLEAMTGISERRYWEPDYPVSQGAVAAAKRALANSPVRAEDVEVLIYAGVCREQFEPATACRVASGLGVNTAAAVYDVSNACLGVLNGMVDVANRIELGQIRAGMIVSCETAREITDIMIERMLAANSMEGFKEGLATLTGGSGAVAVLMTDGSFAREKKHRLLGGATQTAPQHHNFCRWGMETLLPSMINRRIENVLHSAMAQRLEALVKTALSQRIEDVLPSAITHTIEKVLPPVFTQFMSTDSIAVLKYGVDLGQRTWNAFQSKLGWVAGQVDKVICHQVGSSHRDAILKTLGISPDKDFSTFPYLGNVGTVSLPITAALAHERDFLRRGDRVGFLGIGSGLNCLMLGLEW